MDKKIPATSDAETSAARQRLSDLRLALLGLHKALVDCERVGYEKTVGEIKSPNHFLQLLINDPWFAWRNPRYCSRRPKTQRATPGIISMRCSANPTWCLPTPRPSSWSQRGKSDAMNWIWSCRLLL
jgi:hypothetical protein